MHISMDISIHTSMDIPTLAGVLTVLLRDLARYTWGWARCRSSSIQHPSILKHCPSGSRWTTQRQSQHCLGELFMFLSLGALPPDHPVSRPEASLKLASRPPGSVSNSYKRVEFIYMSSRGGAGRPTEHE
jgi:hypothetical protein